MCAYFILFFQRAPAEGAPKNTFELMTIYHSWHVSSWCRPGSRSCTWCAHRRPHSPVSPQLLDVTRSSPVGITTTIIKRIVIIITQVVVAAAAAAAAVVVVVVIINILALRDIRTGGWVAGWLGGWLGRQRSIVFAAEPSTYRVAAGRLSTIQLTCWKSSSFVPVSVKKKLFRRRRTLERQAFRAPSQGAESSSCPGYWPASKGVMNHLFHRHQYVLLPIVVWTLFHYVSMNTWNFTWFRMVPCSLLTSISGPLPLCLLHKRDRCIGVCIGSSSGMNRVCIGVRIKRSPFLSNRVKVLAHAHFTILSFSCSFKLSTYIIVAFKFINSQLSNNPFV